MFSTCAPATFFITFMIHENILICIPCIIFESTKQFGQHSSLLHLRVIRSPSVISSSWARLPMGSTQGRASLAASSARPLGSLARCISPITPAVPALWAPARQCTSTLPPVTINMTGSSLFLLTFWKTVFDEGQIPLYKVPQKGCVIFFHVMLFPFPDRKTVIIKLSLVKVWNVVSAVDNSGNIQIF